MIAIGPAGFSAAPKPKHSLCWECNRRFRGNHKVIVETENGPVAVHKQCVSEVAR